MTFISAGGAYWIDNFDEEMMNDFEITEEFSSVALLSVDYLVDKLDLASKVMLLRCKMRHEQIASLDEFGNKSAQKP